MMKKKKKIKKKKSYEEVRCFSCMGLVGIDAEKCVWCGGVQPVKGKKS